MLFTLAIKNIMGSKLRSFLNIFVTSVSFFTIIFVSGMYDGMKHYAKQITIETEVGGGAYWHPEYDPYDSMTFENSSSKIPENINKLIEKKNCYTNFSR